MRNEGSSIFGAWPIQVIKSQDASAASFLTIIFSLIRLSSVPKHYGSAIINRLSSFWKLCLNVYVSFHGVQFHLSLNMTARCLFLFTKKKRKIIIIFENWKLMIGFRAARLTFKESLEAHEEDKVHSQDDVMKGQ